MSGQSQLIDNIERFERATAELRQAVSDAHAATKDLRQAIREAHEVREAVKAGVSASVDEAVRAGLKATADQIVASTQEGIDNAVAKVTAVVFSASNLCLYGNEQGRGEHIFDEMRRKLAAARLRIEALAESRI